MQLLKLTANIFLTIQLKEIFGWYLPHEGGLREKRYFLLFSRHDLIGHNPQFHVGCTECIASDMQNAFSRFFDNFELSLVHAHFWQCPKGSRSACSLINSRLYSEPGIRGGGKCNLWTERTCRCLSYSGTKPDG